MWGENEKENCFDNYSYNYFIANELCKYLCSE